jgi:tRNA G46 methylase TrmB
MQQRSREVVSSQTGVHPGLARRVLRQARSDWRKPEQAVDAQALHSLDAALATHAGPVVLDSFCGTAESTVRLARTRSEALVIGVDQSAQRLGRAAAPPSNALLLRAHCEAVWRHLAERGVVLEAHFMLYPNPWPKARQLRRRVHGHPAFGLVPRLGGRLELRSNWQVYVEEFGLALHLLGYPGRVCVLPAGSEAMTAFERKYGRSGHRLWRFQADLDASSMHTHASPASIRYPDRT